MDEEVITLITPIGDLTEITLREPTVDELAKVNTESEKFGAVRAMKNLIATMTKLEPAVIGKMGVRDFNACNKYLSGFFE